MSWTLKMDTLYDKSSQEIAFFLPSATDGERMMIKNGDYLIDLIEEFMVGYEENKKQVSKKLFDNFKKVVDVQHNYNAIWKVSPDRELINENNQVVCILTAPSSNNAKLIQHLPILYDAVKELLNSLSSTNRLELNKIYKKVCGFYDKTT